MTCKENLDAAVRRNAMYDPERVTGIYTDKPCKQEMTLKTDILANDIKRLHERCDNFEQEIAHLKNLIYEG